MMHKAVVHAPLPAETVPAWEQLQKALFPSTDPAAKRILTRSHVRHGDKASFFGKISYTFLDDYRDITQNPVRDPPALHCSLKQSSNMPTAAQVAAAVKHDVEDRVWDIVDWMARSRRHLIHYKSVIDQAAAGQKSLESVDQVWLAGARRVLVRKCIRPNEQMEEITRGAIEGALKLDCGRVVITDYHDWIFVRVGGNSDHLSDDDTQAATVRVTHEDPKLLLYYASFLWEGICMV